MERTFHMLLYRAFHAQRNYLRPCLSEVGLEVGQPKLLEYLASHGPCPQRELADYFEIDSAAVSRMLDALEKGRFVIRRQNEQSRRSNLVELTEKGRRANQLWQARCREMEQRVWSDPRVLKSLRDDFVIAALYVDDKTKLPESEWVLNDSGKPLKDIGRVNSYIALKRFGVNSQPNYFILDSDGGILKGPRAYDLDVEGYLEFLSE